MSITTITTISIRFSITRSVFRCSNVLHNKVIMD